MALTGVGNSYAAYAYHTTSSKTGSAGGFSTAINRAGTKTESAVADFKKRHPKEAGTVDKQVNAGKAVLKKNGADQVSREDMTMEEYKRFFAGLMNSIPFDSSQLNDVEIWSITEDGWEQMKSDPDYEAWVLGYTAQDRAVHNPFASMPGYSPNLHTEHFGASIDEHLGQSVPTGNSSGKSPSASGEEDWWKKRHKRMEEFLEQQEKKAQQRRAMATARNQQAQLMQMQMQMMSAGGSWKF